MKNLFSSFASIKKTISDFSENCKHAFFSTSLGVKNKVENTLNDTEEKNNPDVLSPNHFHNDIKMIMKSLSLIKSVIKNKSDSQGKDINFLLLNTGSEIRALLGYTQYLEHNFPNIEIRSFQKILEKFDNDHTVLTKLYNHGSLITGNNITEFSEDTIEQLSETITQAPLSGVNNTIIDIHEKLSNQGWSEALECDISKVIYKQVAQSSKLLEYLDQKIFGLSFSNQTAVELLTSKQSTGSQSAGIQAINQALVSGGEARELAIKNIDQKKGNSQIHNIYQEIFNSISLVDTLDSLLSMTKKEKHRESFLSEISSTIRGLSNSKMGNLIKGILGTSTLASGELLADENSGNTSEYSDLYSSKNGDISTNADARDLNSLEENQVSINTIFGDLLETTENIAFSDFSTQQAMQLQSFLSNQGFDIKIDGLFGENSISAYSEYLKGMDYSGPVDIFGDIGKEKIMETLKTLEIEATPEHDSENIIAKKVDKVNEHNLPDLNSVGIDGIKPQLNIAQTSASFTLQDKQSTTVIKGDTNGLHTNYSYQQSDLSGNIGMNYNFENDLIEVNGKVIYGQEGSRVMAQGKFGPEITSLSVGYESSFVDIYAFGKKQKRDFIYDLEQKEKQSTYGVGTGKSFGDNGYMSSSISKSTANNIDVGYSTYQPADTSGAQLDVSYNVTELLRVTGGIKYTQNCYEQTDFSNKSCETETNATIKLEGLHTVKNIPLRWHAKYHKGVDLGVEAFIDKQNSVGLNYVGSSGGNNFHQPKSINMEFKHHFGEMEKPSHINSAGNSFFENIVEENSKSVAFEKRKKIDTYQTLAELIQDPNLNFTIKNSEIVRGNIFEKLGISSDKRQIADPGKIQGTGFTITISANGDFTIEAEPNIKKNITIPLTVNGERGDDSFGITIKAHIDTIAGSLESLEVSNNIRGENANGAFELSEQVSDLNISLIDPKNPETSLGNITFKSTDGKSGTFNYEVPNTDAYQVKITGTDKDGNTLDITSDIQTTQSPEISITSINETILFGETEIFNLETTGVLVNTLTISEPVGGTFTIINNGTQLQFIAKKGFSGNASAKLSGENKLGDTTGGNIKISVGEEFKISNISKSVAFGKNIDLVFPQGVEIVKIIGLPDGWGINNNTVTPPNNFSGSIDFKLTLKNKNNETVDVKVNIKVAAKIVPINTLTIGSSNPTCSTGNNNTISLANATGDGVHLKNYTLTDPNNVINITKNSNILTIVENSEVEGTYTITMNFEDNQGNSGTASCTESVDTRTPAVDSFIQVANPIDTTATTYTDAFTITFNRSITSGVTFIWEKPDGSDAGGSASIDYATGKVTIKTPNNSNPKLFIIVSGIKTLVGAFPLFPE